MFGVHLPIKAMLYEDQNNREIDSLLSLFIKGKNTKYHRRIFGISCFMPKQECMEFDFVDNRGVLLAERIQ